jgi:hypothetical protein
MTPRESGVAEEESCEVLSEFLIVDQRWCAPINWAMTTIKKWKEVTDSRIKWKNESRFFFSYEILTRCEDTIELVYQGLFDMHWIFPSRVCKLPKWNGGRQPEAAAAHILFISYEKVNLSLLSRVCVCVCVVSVLLIMALALLWLKSVCAPMPSLSPFCLRFPFYSFIMLGNSSLFDSCSFSCVLHSLNGVTHG